MCFFKPLNTNFSKFFAQIWHKKKKKNPTLFFSHFTVGPERATYFFFFFCLMMIALKGRISIYNEGSFCRPSLSILYLILVHVQWCFNYFVFSSFILTVLCAKNICKKDFFRKYFILCHLHDLLCIVHCFICVCVCVCVCVCLCVHNRRHCRLYEWM